MAGLVAVDTQIPTYRPYALDWRFLPRPLLLAKDGLRRQLAALSNKAALDPLTRRFWVATLGDRTRRAILASGLLFIHIPKTAGTSISACLYGRNLPHYTAQFYQTVFGDELTSLPSFSVIRHPVERLISGWAMSMAGGTGIMASDRAEDRQLGGVKTLEDYVAFVEARRSRLETLPRAFHEQSSFIEDGQGRILVDRLFRLDAEAGLPPALADLLGARCIPHLNASRRGPMGVSENLRSRIEHIYARDLDLYESLTSEGERRVRTARYS